MDLTQEQIAKEFRRQVKLCRGIGARRMHDIIGEEIKRADDILDSLDAGTPLPPSWRPENQVVSDRIKALSRKIREEILRKGRETKE